MKEIDDETKRLLKIIIDHCDDEDRSVRDRQIKQWRRLKLMWENVQHAYYSEVAHDWRVPESERAGADSDQAYYDKSINIYRALLESIIAALSVTVPPITCYPDDAENSMDLATAKAGDKIAELIFKHNNAPLLWLHALFIFVTEGMTACYSYPKSDKEYGEYEEKNYEEYEETHEQQICPICGAEMSDKIITEQEQDRFMPGDDTAELDSIVQEMDICQTCARMVVPEKRTNSHVVTRMVGITKHPKSRICMEVYGGLFVKIPNWARNQSECSYLIYSYETHYANVLDKYPDLRDKITKGGAHYDLYEQWGRTSPQYRGEHPINNVTVRNGWLRPCQFNILNSDEADELKKKYPAGCKVTVVDDHVVAAENEAMDDCWTITHNPLADFIHFDPLGVLLTSVQEITDDITSLVVQTIEHGIPQTFADPKVLNFKSYRDSEVIPGGIYPATPKSGKPLSEGFYEVRTATLSQEVLPFAQKIQEAGQMVSGALPSLFGGQMSGSRTASEYSMSRAQALQRLQTNWKMLTMWWKEIFGKIIPMYIKNVKEDERQVRKDEFGNFINTFIRKADLEGKIGSVELEANENLPITWNQQKDSIMELFQMNNDAIMSMLLSPENLPFIKRAIGLNDYVIPGEDDRNKQFEEIQQLMQSEPIEMPPDPMMMEEAAMMGMPPLPPQRLPSIEADFDTDDHGMEADICRRWLVSDAGRLAKLETPMGYENVLLHMKQHRDMDMQRQMQQQMMMAPQMPPSDKSGENKEGSQPKPPENAGVEMGSNDESVPTVQ